MLSKNMPRVVEIRDIQQDNYRTKTFVLDTWVEGVPGQYAMLWLPRFDEKPFSLVDCDPVTFMITAVGPFTRLMHELKVGDRVWLRGPFGQGYRVPPSQRRLALVGGGYGVAPCIGWRARRCGAEQLDIIVGARTANDLLYLERFNGLDVGDASLTVTVATEDGSQGIAGRVTDALRPMLEAQRIDGIYACGPHAMLNALDDLGSQYKVPTQLSWEAYMRCGMGICGSCEHDGKVLCMEGPVLAGRG
ncbi:MAG: hypothetical protein IPK16_03700 [Anaerolineales bacterium]|nr:hypothetical protein [Anaerolineales bacterium]